MAFWFLAGSNGIKGNHRDLEAEGTHYALLEGVPGSEANRLSSEVPAGRAIDKLPLEGTSCHFS